MLTSLLIGDTNLEQIKIELLDHHGSDNSVANAARCSFADYGSWNDLPEDYSEVRAEKLIKYLASHKHMTPFRHNSITIRCTVPIFLARQLMKHQAGLSWNEESRRYVTKQPEFFVPNDWRAKPDGSIKQGSAGIHEYSSKWMENYDQLVKACTTMYECMLADGVAPEMARMVLPQSMLTTYVWTGNLLAFAHVFNERSAAGAQQEAQYFANQLGSILEPLFPIAWGALTHKE